MFENKQPPIHVFWCVWCGRESDEPTCPKCQKPKADLGWKLGESYYSAIERLPKERSHP